MKKYKIQEIKDQIKSLNQEDLDKGKVKNMQFIHEIGFAPCLYIDYTNNQSVRISDDDEILEILTNLKK